MLQNKELERNARAYVDEVWEDVVRDIDRLVQVESVEDKEHAQEGAPYGPAPLEAMTRALRIAERLGLEPHNCEGHIGFADLKGASETYLCTIAHSDIVPLGEGWTVDPLHVTRKEGYLLGRGVLDDKGPLVLSLYAAHYFARQVRERGECLPYTLRCIVGCNEETGMQDVDYYLSHYPEPAFCFSPDACFPLICGEKGRFAAMVSFEVADEANSRIVSLTGGIVPNAVPGKAVALVRSTVSELESRDGIVVEQAGTEDSGTQLCRITATGIGGHASLPEGTRNAIGMLVDYLLDQGIYAEAERGLLEFERLLLSDSYGRELGVACSDEHFDDLTCVGGTICTEHDGSTTRFVQSMDMRYPMSTTGERLLQQVVDVARRCGGEVRSSEDAKPFYISPESNEIKALLDSYAQITGKDGKAITIGGGTYARHFAHAVAFGPDELGVSHPEWVGAEHGPNEGIREEALKQALVIYIVALSHLMQLTY